MHTDNSSLVLMMGGAMADAQNTAANDGTRNGNVTNIYNQFDGSQIGNMANQAQDGAKQNYNAGGEAIAPTQGNGKLVQADGEGLLRSLLGPAAI